MPLLNTPNSENQAINTPLSEQKPAKFEKSRLKPAALLNDRSRPKAVARFGHGFGRHRHDPDVLSLHTGG